VVMDDVSQAISTADRREPHPRNPNEFKSGCSPPRTAAASRKSRYHQILASRIYEVGIAHALDKPLLLISQSLDEVPFDLRYRRILLYDYSPKVCKRLEQAIVDHLTEMLPAGIYEAQHIPAPDSVGSSHLARWSLPSKSWYAWARPLTRPETRNGVPLLSTRRTSDRPFTV
jgi:hypothetical protein